MTSSSTTSSGCKTLTSTTRWLYTHLVWILRGTCLCLCPCLCPCPCLCLCLCLSVSVSVSLSLCLCLSVSVFVCLCFYLCPCLCPRPCPCLCLCLCLCLCFCWQSGCRRTLRGPNSMTCIAHTSGALMQSSTQNLQLERGRLAHPPQALRLRECRHVCALETARPHHR